MDPRLTRIASALALALLATGAAEAKTFKKDNWSLELPAKWAVVTGSPPGVTLFDRDGDDYPVARVATLPRGTDLADPQLPQLINAEEQYDSSRVTLDKTFTQAGRPVRRRLDFSYRAHSDGYTDSAIIVDPGLGMPLLMLDVKSGETSGVNSFKDCITHHSPTHSAADCIREREKTTQITAEIEHMLASFHAVSGGDAAAAVTAGGGKDAASKGPSAKK